MNATQIRRHTWVELAHVSLDKFTLVKDAEAKIAESKDIETSEVPEERDYFWSVDKHGYMTSDSRLERGFKHVPVDSLIKAGRRRMESVKEAKAKQEAGEEVQFDEHGWPIDAKRDKRLGIDRLAYSTPAPLETV